jgi:RNA polymerase sigma factor (sigma-70 family)
MPLDPVQLEELIGSQLVPLQLWVGRRCASCEDVVQEAFCRLAYHEPAPEKPVAWLYRVCRNLAEGQRISDERRREREKRLARPDVGTADPAENLEISETLAAVKELAGDLREVLVARIWGELSFEEISTLCGISTATAFRRYQAALKDLRSKLEIKSGNRP